MSESSLAEHHFPEVICKRLQRKMTILSYRAHRKQTVMTVIRKYYIATQIGKHLR